MGVVRNKIGDLTDRELISFIRDMAKELEQMVLERGHSSLSANLRRVVDTSNKVLLSLPRRKKS